MCGIALVIDHRVSLEAKTKNIISQIKHRGPDDEGFYFENNLALGSNRLSILDLSENGRMPFTDKTGLYKISFNGEIYNYIELKKQFNISTKTNTDTEVLIELYAKLKEKMLDHLNGIFAFTIYDSESKKIFCARDRLGIKPLYYFISENGLIISSEIKGIINTEKNLKIINEDTLLNYLKTSFYDVGENTFYKNIFSLQASHYMIYSLSEKKIAKFRYWNLKENLYKKKSDDLLMNELHELIQNSFKIQTRTDTDLGVNLSGGIDSKLMMLTLDKMNNGQKKVKASSFYFDDEEYSERYDLQNFSSNINWKIDFFKITPEDIINNFDDIYDSQDEPFPGIPTIGKDLLIRRGYDKNFKVILEGQGGDDFAAGYYYVYPFYIKSLFKKFEYIQIYKEIKNFTKKENINLYNFMKFYFSSINSFNGKFISADGTSSYDRNILNPKYKNKENIIYKRILNDISFIKNPLKRIIYRDLFYCKLPRILRSCDRASMSHGKELRVPLLDHNIVEFFFNLKDKQLINNGNLRDFYRHYIQKFYPEISSDEIFKKKKYVSDPQVKWLKTHLYEWALEKLSSKYLKNSQIYDHKLLIEKFKKFKNENNEKNSNVFWQALCIERLQKKISYL